MCELLLGVRAALVAGMLACAATGEEEARDFTCFQTGSGYMPEIDIGADVAIVYGVNASFPERVAGWRNRGYGVGMMTGIAWGGYDAYFGSGEAFKKEEIQTRKNGTLFMHGQSTTVGYNVPTEGYVAYLKNHVVQAVDAGVRAVYLEEPEYWAQTGWSAAFKRAWEQFYGEPWAAPDSSVDAQYRASKLKYELYFKALKEVFAQVDARGRDKGLAVECHVPTHSLINYAHWGIVSPESHLIDIPELDGYIAQVWTGTARTPNVYRGVRKERTFETAFLEYGQMLGMVRPTGKKVWFLADPIEDNPNHSWSDYKANYECTVVASLMWPEVHRYEVMPWPRRIFKGAYPKVDLDTKSGEREGIPSAYATEVLTIINALNDMDQPDVAYETGSRGIGVIVSDTLMFQRAAPEPSDRALGSFYGLALPLVKHGIPVEIVQLENVLHAKCLERCRVLLLTYEGQKPLKGAYHEALADWVRRGGCLIYVGDGSDPYHGVREWWNGQGETKVKAFEDLFERLGVTEEARRQPQQVGQGYVRVVVERPRDLQRDAAGADKVVAGVREVLRCLGGELETQHYLQIRRGPYVVASVLDESVSNEPLRLTGTFVDLFDPTLPVIEEKVLGANERTLLYDLAWAQENGVKAKVVAAAARVKNEAVTGNSLTFVTRGPEGTDGVARVLLPGKPQGIVCNAQLSVAEIWDKDSASIVLSWSNCSDDVAISIYW